MDLSPIPLICGGKQMSNNSQDIYKQLHELIQANKNKEIECREFLYHARTALVPDTVLDFVYVEKERRGTSGDSDYIISVRAQDETGLESVKAYIWELKAPQCYMFEKDTENRLRPSKELIQAENQLLHYYHEHKGSELSRNDFGITHSDNINFGGIIIGCHHRRVKGHFADEVKKAKLLEKALMIRIRYIYDPLHIRIVQWDYILDLLKPSTVLQPQKTEEIKFGIGSLSPANIVISST